jgi:(2R)-sulfolactate sulfo-lyase subunit alpha
MIHFIVHAPQDSVGVLVKDATKNQKLTGWNMETDATVEIVTKEDIPLGHKVALKSVKAGEKVIKYNVPIGKASQDITPGERVHTHNLKTARW